MTTDRFGCLEGTIKVASGKYFDISNPDPDLIDLYSIASALGRICRFGGHCPAFYSVAEHCVHCVALAEKDGVAKHALRAILLHDATEAYIGDMVRPLKIMLPEYSAIEKRVENAIGERYGIDFKLYEAIIQKYDRLMLKAEKVKFWPLDTEVWEGFEAIETREVHFRYSNYFDAYMRFFEKAVWLDICD